MLFLGGKYTYSKYFILILNGDINVWYQSNLYNLFLARGIPFEVPLYVGSHGNTFSIF